MPKIQKRLKKDISRPAFWLLVFAAVLVKVVLSRFQMIYT